jgi:hypothetical protein
LYDNFILKRIKKNTPSKNHKLELTNKKETKKNQQKNCKMALKIRKKNGFQMKTTTSDLWTILMLDLAANNFNFSIKIYVKFNLNQSIIHFVLFYAKIVSGSSIKIAPC